MLGKGAGKRPIGGGSGEGAHWRRDAGEGVLEGGYLGRGPIGGGAGKGCWGRGLLEGECWERGAGEGPIGERECRKQSFLLSDTLFSLQSLLKIWFPQSRLSRRSRGQKIWQPHYLTGPCPKRVGCVVPFASALECTQPRHQA